MDSESDQDEDELNPSFSETISEGASHCCVLGRVCSDTKKESAEMCNNSGSIEETSVKENVFIVEDTISDTSSIDSLNIANEDQSHTLIKVSCCRPQKTVSYKNVVDDRIFCAEKAMDDVCDSVHNVQENEDDNSRQETSQSSQDNSEQIPNQNEFVTNTENSSEHSSIPHASVTAPVDRHTQNELVDRPEEKMLLNENTPEKTSHDLSPHQSTTTIDKNMLQSINTSEVQNKTSEISQSGSCEAIEMIAQSLVFQSTSVDPVENSLSTHSVGSSGLTKEGTSKESEHESSSTGQLAGRKRKHSGKVQCHPVGLCIQEYLLFRGKRA